MNLEDQVSEYNAVQSWLRGDKPTPTGRTWRRRMTQVALAPVVAAVKTTKFVSAHPIACLVPSIGTIFLLMTAPLVFNGMSALMGPEALQHGLPMDQVVNQMMSAMKYAIPILSCVGMGVFLVKMIRG
jgi:hypothetical protein